MERLLAATADVTALCDGWTLVLTPGGDVSLPSELDRADALPATVPGTVAHALAAAGRYALSAPEPLLEKDAWYRLEQPLPAGHFVLRLEGLATIAEVFLDDSLVLTSSSMFESHDLDLDLGGGEHLSICFRALKPHLDRSGPRARWRPRMMTHQGLRLVRTTLLGHMPGWCPEVHAAGPYRPVSLLARRPQSVSGLSLHARLSKPDEGTLSVSFKADGPGPFTLVCNGSETGCVQESDGTWQASLAVAGIRPWFPHTHGDPVLYPVHLKTASGDIPLGSTGFRTLEVDTGEDGRGFQVKVNGIPVFCRGAVWTNADILSLPAAEEACLPLLELAAAAGMNMIRIGGTMTYEAKAFFDCCDRLGILVWQDYMFANFDYPAKDEAFLAHVTREVEDLLRPLSASPSLAVLCGGSEIYQQGAMLGLPKTLWEGPLSASLLRELSALYRPDCVYVPNSPFGGAMPFAPSEGVTHYYGVGAYERPLEDARRAAVRFSAESLAFAQVPQQRVLDAHLPVPAVHDPRWKARVPRDRDASWDFEDTRDHYLNRLYGFDPARLRREDPARYLDFSRAVTGEVSEAVFAEWRRPASTCGGGLVWTLRDFLPGAGWGIIDATGEPKPVYYALKRAFRPLQLILTDEGTNGLDIHLVNDRPDARATRLEINCLRDGRQPVVSAARDLRIEGHARLSVAATDLIGAFFDTTYAFRFGPPSHDVVVARLLDAETGTLLADQAFFPLGRREVLHAATIDTSLVRDDDGWVLLLKTDRFAQSVHVDSEHFRPEDDWFHLAPGPGRRIRLLPRASAAADSLPSGTVRSLGSKTAYPF